MTQEHTKTAPITTKGDALKSVLNIMMGQEDALKDILRDLNETSSEERRQLLRVQRGILIMRNLIETEENPQKAYSEA